jgi:hypothetical protein
VSIGSACRCDQGKEIGRADTSSANSTSDLTGSSIITCISVANPNPSNTNPSNPSNPANPLTLQALQTLQPLQTIQARRRTTTWIGGHLHTSTFKKTILLQLLYLSPWRNCWKSHIAKILTWPQIEVTC